MYCQNCGKELSDGSLLCDACGAKIISAASPAQPDNGIPQQSAGHVCKHNREDLIITVRSSRSLRLLYL